MGLLCSWARAGVGCEVGCGLGSRQRGLSTPQTGLRDRALQLQTAVWRAKPVTHTPHKQPARRPAPGPEAGSAARGLRSSPHNIWLLPWKQLVVMGRRVGSGGCVAPWVFMVGEVCFLCFSGVPVIIQNRKVWVAGFFFFYVSFWCVWECFGWVSQLALPTALPAPMMSGYNPDLHGKMWLQEL